MFRNGLLRKRRRINFGSEYDMMFQFLVREPLAWVRHIELSRGRAFFDWN